MITDMYCDLASRYRPYSFLNCKKVSLLMYHKITESITVNLPVQGD